MEEVVAPRIVPPSIQPATSTPTTTTFAAVAGWTLARLMREVHAVEYLERVPRAVPAGMVVVRNQVRRAARLEDRASERGPSVDRAWTKRPDPMTIEVSRANGRGIWRSTIA